jgi:hypothetical protein
MESMGVRMLVLTIVMTCDDFASHLLGNNPFNLRKVVAKTESKPKESSVGGIGLVYASGAGASFRSGPLPQ